MAAFSFELGKCLHDEIKDRMLANLANVATPLAVRVAANLGKPAPPKGKPASGVEASPALSLLPFEAGPITGRVIGVLAADGVDGTGLAFVRKQLETAGATVVIIAPHGGTISTEQGPVAVTKSRAHDPVASNTTLSSWPAVRLPKLSVRTPTLL